MAGGPKVHHTVFCVKAENLARAALVWSELGFELAPIELEDLGLSVLLDWNRGVELIAPLATPGTQTTTVQRHLDEHGEGLYSVVVLTDHLDEDRERMARLGASTVFRQDRSGDGFTLVEAMLTPVLGMPITLLATDLEG